MAVGCSGFHEASEEYFSPSFLSFPLLLTLLLSSLLPDPLTPILFTERLPTLSRALHAPPFYMETCFLVRELETLPQNGHAKPS